MFFWKFSKNTTGVLEGNILALFLLIVVIYYVSTRSAWDFWYLTHKGNIQDNKRTFQRTIRESDYKLNDLVFAEDIFLLENDSTQQKLDALEFKAGKNFLEKNVQKTDQMRLNQSFIYLQNGQHINIVDGFLISRFLRWI